MRFYSRFVRTEAKRRHLHIIGTLGVLAEAHFAGLLTFDRAVADLRQTNFYLPEDAIAQLRRQLAQAEERE